MFCFDWVGTQLLGVCVKIKNLVVCFHFVYLDDPADSLDLKPAHFQLRKWLFYSYEGLIVWFIYLFINFGAMEVNK